VSTAQTWPALEVPYRVTDRTFVNAPWTVAPGTVMEFDAGVSIVLGAGGSLDLTGTDSEPIQLRGVEAIRGYWKGIQVTTEASANVLDHVELRDAGSDPWAGGVGQQAGLYVTNEASVSITNSAFVNNEGYAIKAPFVNTTFPAFADNLFYGNVTPMGLHANRAGELDEDTAFSSGVDLNDNQYVELTFSNTDTVSSTQTWPALEVPYRVGARTFVEAPLTIAAGARLEFAQDVEFVVRDTGSLTLAGTELEPVLLVGAEDLQGYWVGVLINTASASNVFTHAVIGNGGSTDGEGIHVANVEVLNGSLALVGSVEVSDSGGFGLYVDLSDLTGCPVLTGSGNASGLFGGEDSTSDCVP
jgi:hypothetical protein